MIKQKLLCLIGAVALLAGAPAMAQLQSQVVAGSDNGTTRRVLLTDNTGRLLVVGSAAGNAVYGPDANNTAPSQPGISIGAQYLSTMPTYTTGNVGYLQMGSRGALNVNICSASATTCMPVASAAADAQSNSTTAMNNYSLTSVFNGTTWDRMRSANIGDGATSTGILAAGAYIYNGTNYDRARSSGNTGSLAVGGAIAAAATDAGNPVKIGGKVNTTLPTYTDGQRGDIQLGTRGSLNVSVCGSNTTNCSTAQNPADGGSAAIGLVTYSQNIQYNGTTYDRQYGISGALSTGVGTQAVAIAPQSAATGAIVPAVSTALESNRVGKASAGNFYRGTITTTTLGGYFMIFNATTAPADGAVTPLICRAVAAGSSTEIDHSQMPDRFGTGITAVFSTTGCFTKTASATASFELSVQ